jgi:hypothetical protein
MMPTSRNLRRSSRTLYLFSVTDSRLCQGRLFLMFGSLCSPLLPRPPVHWQQQTDDGDDLKYADTLKLACLLCLRQFHSIDEIKRHNLLSALHKVFFALEFGRHRLDSRAGGSKIGH